MQRIIMSLALCCAFFIVLPIGQALAQDYQEHNLMVPYNVINGGFWTGIHVACYWYTEDLSVTVIDASNSYTSTIPLDDRGQWTGLVQNILSNPNNFMSPSLLIFTSVKGPFTITKFLGNENGFGFETYYSAPGSTLLESWPYQ